MIRTLILLILTQLLINGAKAQYAYTSHVSPLEGERLFPKIKVYTRSYGATIGIQRGRYTFFELGAAYNWRKVKLIRPVTYSLGANMEYNFGHNVLGYKVGGWVREGRFNLTYGLNMVYYTDFRQHRIGGGPVAGLRLLNFHFTTGYNFTVGASEFVTFNPLYVSLRYYIPTRNKIKIKKEGNK